MGIAASEDVTVRPWLAEYPPGVPTEINPNHYCSLADLLDSARKRHGGAVAFHSLGVDLSFQQLDEYSACLAAYFQQDLRLQKGDRIALMMPNVLQYPIALFAALRAGLIVVNVNPLYTASELVMLITESRPRAIVVLETFAATLERALKTAPVETIIVARIAELQRFPRSLIVDYVVRRKKKLVPAWNIPGAMMFRQAMLARPAEAFRAPPLSLDDIAFLQFTGGTTGAPKGAVLTHGNVLADVLVYDAWSAASGDFGAADTAIIALPLYHVAALICQCLIAIHFGVKAVLVINPRDVPALVKDFALHKPTLFLGLNTLFAALLNNPAFQQLDFALRVTAAGGAATQPVIAERWQALTGCPVLEGYGLSEVAGVVIAQPPSRAGLDGAIGVPMPSVMVEIRDEHGKPSPFGNPGEICVKGPMVMRGYYNRPEETAKVLGEDGFFATGDIGVMDARGVIRIVDRKKDMVLVSGFNVYPTEVEAVLSRHPGILEVAVVGVSDMQSGEAPVACVVKKDATLTEAEIISYARESLAAYKAPRRVVFVDELPKTPVGKVLRRLLRDQLTA
jgi:long-chain acyl-CoA synthetase